MAIINFSSIVSDGISGIHKEGSMLLSEGSRDKQLSVYLPLFQKRGIDISLSQLKQILLNKFVSEAGMHNLSLGGNYYLAGVARYYFNGDLTSNRRLNALYSNVTDKFIPDVCTKLDALINVLRNAYIDSVGTQFEQPEDFGELKLSALFKKYGKLINSELGIETKKTVKEKPVEVFDHNASANYTYEILYSYDDAKKFNRYTEPGAWCITYGEQHYNSYIRRLGIHYVVFMKNGFEKVERKVGPGFTKKKPHDEYGNSLICVLQSNTSPDPIYITSRWNHGSYNDNTSGTEADHAYTTEEFLNVIGCDSSVLERAFREWSQNRPKKEKKDTSKDRKEKLGYIRKFKYAQMMLNAGQDPQNIFDTVAVINFYDDGFTKDFKFAAFDGGNGTWWYTLLYKRKLFYDMFINNSTYFNGRFQSVKKNSAIFTIGDSHYVFDRIRSRFVDIDGKTKFKHFDSSTSHLNGNDPDEKYIFVCLNGKQIAMIDGKTMKPIRAKNGGAWFETIVSVDTRMHSNYSYSGKINLPYSSCSNNSIYYMVYDSSANEEYYFDGKRRSFIDIDVPSGYKPTAPPRIDDCIVFSSFDAKYTQTFMIFSAKDNNFLEFEGHAEFFDAEACGHVLKVKLEKGGDYHVYDMRTRIPIMVNNEKLVTKMSRIIYRDEQKGLVAIESSNIRFDTVVLSSWYIYDENAYSICCDKNGRHVFYSSGWRADILYGEPDLNSKTVEEFYPMNSVNESVIKQDFWKILNGIENSRKLLR